MKMHNSVFRCQMSNVRCQSGQFLLEIVIAVAVMMILAHAFFTLISSSYQILTQSRSQSVAKAVINEKMEIIRNLDYDSVGTVGGIPSGELLQEETVIRNGQLFNVSTDIIYKDDSYDDLAPDDTNPADYKLARIEVSWIPGGFPSAQKLVMVTNISPRGGESLLTGGTLNVLVFNSLGVPVAQANVLIEATSVGVSLSQTTDDFGRVTLPGAPVCNSCYSIIVNKTDYSTDRTYDFSEVTNPTKPPLSILAGQVSQISFAIDTLADVNFNSVGDRDSGFPALGDVTFHLQSEKTIGTDGNGDPVYKLDEDYSTDGGGSANLQLESANYVLTMDASYDLGGSNPFSPLNISAGGSMDVTMSAVEQTANSLLANVQDVGGSPIASASARLTNMGISYDGSIDTGGADDTVYGQAWFGDLTSASDYILEVSHDDYETSVTDNLEVSGSSSQTVILNPK